MFPEKIGRYEILAELGRGGMAAVYKARDPRFKRDVAIKVLPASFVNEPTFRARFEREAQTIAALEFPGIVPVYDFGEENGQPYLVMRYMQGGSLYSKLRQGSLGLVESSRMITRLAGALDYVHLQGIIHRDLKPANILFDQFTNAHLSDFGIARLQEASVALTGDGMIGTPAYMSPEQARGETDIDGRSDIYALGAIIFEMLTGRQPYEATTPMGVAMKHVLDPAPLILSVRSDLPVPCEDLILHAMAKDREARYQTASEMAHELARIAASVADTPPPTIVDEVNLVQPEAVKPIAPPPSPIPIPIPPSQSAAPEPIRQPTPAPPAEEAAPEPVHQPTPAPPVEATAHEPIRQPTPAPPAEAVVPAPIRQPTPAPPAKAAVQAPIRQPTPAPPVRSASHTPAPISRKPSSKSLVSIIAIGIAGLLCLVLFVFVSLRGFSFFKNFLNFRASVLESTPTQSTSSEAVAAPTVANTPLAVLGNVLFQDDFSDPTSGWESYHGSDSIRDYENGAYRILVDVPNQYYYSTAGQNFTDVSIKVDTTKVAGPDDNFFGIICRFQDLNNFYFSIISSDGYYAIGKIVGGEVLILGQDDMLYSETIHRGETDNLLQGTCDGDRLALSVNNVELVSAQDTTFSSGDVGLLVGTFETYGANMIFDNFIVAQP